MMENRIEEKIVEILLNIIHKADLSHLSEKEVELIRQDLLAKGYQHNDLQSILRWLVAHAPGETVGKGLQRHPNHFRVLHPVEKTYLDADAQGIIMRLQNQRIMAPLELEEMLQHVAWFAQERLTGDDLQDFLDVMQSLSDNDPPPGSELPIFLNPPDTLH
ncbi:MAG: DUF494 family protein [Candidatus Delongbacteria bacterium]|nr:DUF494 family protein [Candidatus Delongbacteria bacterium]